MKHLKKFNEDFDPMGSWDPKHPSNLENEVDTNFESLSKMIGNLLKVLQYPKKLKEYLDENTKNTKLKEEISNGMGIRGCIKGSWKSKNEVGDSFYESFVILFDFIGSDIKTSFNDRNLFEFTQFAAEFCRLDILEYLESIGCLKVTPYIISWLEISRRQPQADKEKVLDYLKSFI
jgi:hypothetical protein